jgi:hydroxyethylthiazole kinase-like uncharacterized protein yjeF
MPHNRRMKRIRPGSPLPLHDVATTRRIESEAQSALPPHTLMQRAGEAIARLARATAPHARHVWIACGPGNNGGDGLEAAHHLRRAGLEVSATWLGSPADAPADAHMAWRRLSTNDVSIARQPPASADLCIDALLGIGARRAPDGEMAVWIQHMQRLGCPILSVDVPSGLDADTGRPAGRADGLYVRAHHVLSLLTLKPGLFTALGRDAATEVWFDDLGVAAAPREATAWLAGAPTEVPREHASHKGTRGDVVVVGGAPGMSGAAWLAGLAALHGGAGRVYVCTLSGERFAPNAPELMGRSIDEIDLTHCTCVSGCGGGDAIGAVLPRLLSRAPRLVLDADALNAIATDPSLQEQLRARGRRHWPTVLTPHPLEAARLLGTSTAEVQADRLSSAQLLANQTQAVVVLKGSGSVIASPTALPCINPTGNGRLATAGTGDVLAGLIGARLAAGAAAFDAARDAVYHHGLAADQWPVSTSLTAASLARALAS